MTRQGTPTRSLSPSDDHPPLRCGPNWDKTSTFLLRYLRTAATPVSGTLAELGPKWTVLHSVPVGRGDGDIDHVVIGPPGVFTINTKSHPGQEIWMAGHGLLVSGRRTNYIGIAAAEAFRAEALLSSASGLTVTVVPMVILVNPGERTIRAVAEDGVRVLADWELLAELQSARREFSDEQVEQIVAAAVQPRTWRAEPLPAADTENLALRFNAMVARSAQVTVASLVLAEPAVVAPAAEAVGAAVAQGSPAPTRAPVPPPTPPVAYPRVSRPHQTRPSQGVAPRSRRRRRSSTNIVGRLVAAGIMLWFLYGGLLPAVQASLTS